MAVTTYPVNRGTVAGDGTGDTAYVGTGKLNDSIANLKSAVDLVLDVGQYYLIGRNSAGTGNPEKLTAATVRTILNVENGATADMTAGEIEAIVNHDNLIGFVANEHLDWTADLGATNIHYNNLPVFTSTLPGAVPLSGGGTTNYLRADGTWAAPPGGGGGGPSFETIVITDTDSGNTWTETGNIVAEAALDTLTLVSGDGMDLDASPTTDAILFAIKAAQTTITSIYNTSLRVGYSSSAYMDFNSTSFDISFASTPEFRFENDGDFHADGNIFAYSTTTTSDLRLKTDLVPIWNALEKLELLEGCTFTMKKTGERRAGLIAQHVLEVLPEAVRESNGASGEEPHLSLDYNAVVGLLVQAVRELHDKVCELEARV